MYTKHTELGKKYIRESRLTPAKAGGFSRQKFMTNR